MSDIICVTNRRLCKTDFLQRIGEIASCRPRAIILREKDMSESAYRQLAQKVMMICERQGIPCILHSFVNTAIELKAAQIHLPLPVLRRLPEAEKAYFSVIGVSCHSVEEAVEAQRLGCTYITAGHIFATDCKKGLPPRGINMLKRVCENVSVPVYAIGGINNQNIKEVRGSGARGACIMSGLMCCGNVRSYIDLCACEERKIRGSPE